mmetsp:Transcript_63561/g.76413  ORF Transcript_63561/g.76413 Transcript_63561/m.76413 type:complete len:87 (-) Transcript_63561:449-709(-)
MRASYIRMGVKTMSTSWMHDQQSRKKYWAKYDCFNAGRQRASRQSFDDHHLLFYFSSVSHLICIFDVRKMIPSNTCRRLKAKERQS